MTETPVKDSANNPLIDAADQVPAGLDSLLESVLSEEDPLPKKRGRKKKEAPAKHYKEVLWASADKLRNQMDAAVYKHLVLGMIFLKYISDAFVEQQQQVLAMACMEDQAIGQLITMFLEREIGFEVMRKNSLEVVAEQDLDQPKQFS